MSRSAEFKEKQRKKAIRLHSEEVLANPDRYSRLKVARSTAGLSQEQLGLRAHVSKCAISEIENGRHATSTTKSALAEALELEIKDLWDNVWY